MQKTKNISGFFSSRKSISVKNLKYPGPSKNQTMAIFKRKVAKSPNFRNYLKEKMPSCKTLATF